MDQGKNKAGDTAHARDRRKVSSRWRANKGKETTNALAPEEHARCVRMQLVGHPRYVDLILLVKEVPTVNVTYVFVSEGGSSFLEGAVNSNQALGEIVVSGIQRIGGPALDSPWQKAQEQELCLRAPAPQAGYDGAEALDGLLSGAPCAQVICPDCHHKSFRIHGLGDFTPVDTR